MFKISLLYCISFLGFGIDTSKLPEPDSLQSDPQETVILKQGEIVSLQLYQDIKSDEWEVNSIVPMSIKVDIVVDGKRVALTGAYAEGRVIRVKPAKSFGRAGFIEVEALNIQLIDGQRVDVAGKSIRGEGRSRKMLAWLVAIGTPGLGAVFAASADNAEAIPFMVPFAGLGFLVKGREGVLSVNTTISAKVAQDVVVRLE